MNKLHLPRRITERKVLFVEGKDEEVFFKVLLQKQDLHGVQIISSGGKEQFSSIFPEIIKMPDFDEVQALAVIQDTDTNSDSVFQSICHTLKKEQLSVPKEMSHFTSEIPKVGIFTLPNGKDSGSLESLCLSTVQSEGITNCIEPFIECIKQKTSLEDSQYKLPKSFNKAKCKAFLSAMEDDTPSLGIAAEKGYWNLESDKLNPLLSFLKILAGGS